MNPFEEPNATFTQQSSPERSNASQRINWLGIVVAGGIYVVGYLILRDILLKVSTEVPGRRPAALYFPIPCIIAAVFLAWKSRNRWFMAGMVYSTIPAIGVCIEVVYTDHFTTFHQFLTALLIGLTYLAASVPITLGTMAITRILLMSQNP